MFELRLSGGDFKVTTFHDLGLDLKKGHKRVISRLGKFISRSAKMRASPRYRWSASGKLSRSIKLSMKNKGFVIVANSRSAYYQENGFTPHYVPIKYLSPRAKSLLPEGVTRIMVKKSKPFIEPALQKGLEKLDEFIDNELDKI